MANEIIQRDQNFVTVLAGITDDANQEIRMIRVDPVTGRVMVSGTGGTGDVVGPASSTDNAVARFDGATGKLLQNSVVLIGDTGAVTGVESMQIGGSTYSYSGTLQITSVVSGPSGFNTGLVLRGAAPALILEDTGGNDAMFALDSGDLFIYGGSAATTLFGRWGSSNLTLSTGLLFATDNALDIGASAATRPRTGYFGTSLITPLVNAPTGNLTLSSTAGQVIITSSTGTGQPVVVNSVQFYSTVTQFGTPITPTSSDGSALGSATVMWSDLFLASGALINFDNSNVVLTHSSGILTVSTGDLRVTTAGTNSASVVTVGGTQTLTNKTFTSPVINSGTIGTSLVPTANDGAALGSGTNMFSDLFLASGAVLNFNNGDITLTHSSNLLTYAGGQFTFGANTAYFTETDNGNSSTADTIDWTVSNKQKSTLTGNVTYTFTAPGGPCNLVLKILTGAGSFTVTWPATVKWAGGTPPTITTTASRADIITFYYDGTNYYGSYLQNYTP